jgi:hypothetical protein
MRYSLRTLLIVMAILPPVIAAPLPKLQRLLWPKPPPTLFLPPEDVACINHFVVIEGHVEDALPNP